MPPLPSTPSRKSLLHRNMWRFSKGTNGRMIGDFAVPDRLRGRIAVGAVQRRVRPNHWCIHLRDGGGTVKGGLDGEDGSGWGLPRGFVREVAQWADLQRHQVAIRAWDLTHRFARHDASVKEAGKVPPGLDIPMCLVLGADTIACVLESYGEPYIVAASTRYHSSQAQVNEDGHFKLALASLLHDLYPLLASGDFDWQDLKPFAKPIFASAYV